MTKLHNESYIRITELNVKVLENLYRLNSKYSVYIIHRRNLQILFTK